MKKLILVFAAIAITGSAYAQTDSTKVRMGQKDMSENQNQNQNVQNKTVDKSHADGVMMQNGKLIQVKDGQVTTVEEDLTLKNGTKIKSDGTYIKKDGSKMTLKEGERFDMAGNVIPMKDRTDKNMYLVPDSTTNKN
jgi:hypothetical protein